MCVLTCQNLTENVACLCWNQLQGRVKPVYSATLLMMINCTTKPYLGPGTNKQL